MKGTTLRGTAELLFVNASIRTQDPRRPTASALAITDGRVAAVGDQSDVKALSGPDTGCVDCRGATLLPGFVDPHVHLLAWAARTRSVDCGPAKAPTIGALTASIAERALQLPPGAWIRAVGYDETVLAERRHPTRDDLDRAAPQNPVRLQHRSGHAWVLSSAALAALGERTLEGLERDAGGHATGLWLESDSALHGGEAALSAAELATGMRAVADELLRAGVTTVHDATPSDVAGLELLRRLVDEAPAFPDVRAMRNWKDVGPCSPGETLKVMLRAGRDGLEPTCEDLVKTLVAASRAGATVAIHVVEEDALVVALEAVEQARAQSTTPVRVRFEHVSVCPPALAPQLAAIGVWVVTQPGFVRASGDRYLQEVEPERQPWLYPVGSLLERAVRVAFSSDAPFGPAAPLANVHAAVTRRTAGGAVLGPDERIDRWRALGLCTREAAAAVGLPDRGVIRVGARADLALLGARLEEVSDEEIGQVPVAQTFLAGVPAMERGPGR